MKPVDAMWLAFAGLMACNDGSKDPATDGDDTDGTDSPVASEWTTVAEDLGSALLSVTGTSASDVWTVGANADGTGGLILHWDGSTWTRVDGGFTNDLWWVWLEGSEAVWVVGAGGEVGRYERSSQTWEKWAFASEFTLFGIWGSSGDDVWVVGGNTSVSSNGARAWHYDGAVWGDVVLPAELDAVGSVFKVWGRSASDVWMCASQGLAIHFDGASWTPTATGTTSDLFTVSGALAGPDVWASGGGGNGVILRWDGAAWADESPDFAPTIPGIFAQGETPVAASHAGTIFARSGTTWAPDERGLATFQDFHAVWQDPDGGIWAVGGSIKSNPLDLGTLIYGGPDAPGPYPP